ncbi:MAG: hypothetical protein ACOCXP_02320 [Candidatus Dojkabacteria bacterium]
MSEKTKKRKPTRSELDLMAGKGINTTRIKQLKEFIAKPSPIIDECYELFDNESADLDRLKKELKKLIIEDPYFCDPYISLAEIYQDEDNFFAALDFRMQAFQAAMSQVANKEGEIPQKLEWGWIENRHIIRAIDMWAYELWYMDLPEVALGLFRQLLKANIGDNIGARNAILAINLNLAPDFVTQWETKEGFLDGGKMMGWFDKNYKKFPEEFGWWEKATRKKGLVEQVDS